MNYKIYNEKKELIAWENDHEKALKEFTTCLFNKFITKSNSYKQVQYHYNYSDSQKITFIFDNKCRIIFEDVSTSMGHLKIK